MYLFPCLYLTIILNKFLILVLQIWYHNVPHTKLAEVKGHQNWVKVDGEYLTFPGGGTQFKHGALHYIDFIQQVRNFLFTFNFKLHPVILCEHVNA